jgi:hypothetical protein
MEVIVDDDSEVEDGIVEKGNKFSSNTTSREM